jgi:hypothetical protein
MLDELYPFDVSGKTEIHMWMFCRLHRCLIRANAIVKYVRENRAPTTVLRVVVGRVTES